MTGEELVDEARKFEPKLLNFFARQGVSSSEGEDLVQETYLRVWNYRRSYRKTSAKFSTFLFLLAKQVRIDALRRRIRRENREASWGKDQPVEAAPAAAGAKEDVRWALDRLSQPLRDVVELAVMRDMRYFRVAKILGIPEGTVKSRMANALKKLKEIFDEQGS
jgi:RNA polymerase sigma-70 factor (ECF subfamily)